MSKMIPNFPNLETQVVENEMNVEFQSLKAGYDTAKARREQFMKEYQSQPYRNEKQGQSSLVDYYLRHH